MKADQNNIGQVFQVKLVHYKSFRHYGGRSITSYPCVVNAKLIGLQDDYQRYVVELSDTYVHDGEVVYRAGHKIAVPEKDLII